MKYNYILLIFVAALLFNGCHKDFEFKDFNYESYNRLVGPEGGTINFYANYSNDTKNEVIATMDVPAGALDSLMVFNLYQFEDFEVTTQMENGFSKIGSKLLYFVPFYESDGYHERGQFDLNYHLSIKFKEPVTVTYHPLANYSDLSLKNWQEVELYNNYYKTTNKSYKVYRIKIPKIDQWGEDYNIYINWTRQGYANGYDPTDISYLVNGRWSAGDSWGKGDISMDNWEVVFGAEIDAENDLVTFKVFDTDYIYVVARDVFLPFIPFNLTNFVDANFTGMPAILRASYDDVNYKLYYSDNSIAVFDNDQYFQYLINDYAVLPPEAATYISDNYPKNVVKKVVFKRYIGFGEYEIVLSGGIKLFFNEYNQYVSFSYSTQYGFNAANLPDAITAYMGKYHPDELITNVTLTTDYYGYTSYIVYLSSNAKVYFYGDAWSYTYYFKMSVDKLPPLIRDHFSTNFPDAVFSEINHTIYQGSSNYEVILVDSKRFEFDGEGVLLQYDFRNLSEKDLPDLLKNYIDNNPEYSQKIITSVSHHYDNREGQPYEYFEIYFSDYTSLILNPDSMPNK